MAKTIQIIFDSIFGIGWFPMIVFLALWINRKKEPVPNMEIAYALSLGYMGFIFFSFMVCGGSFNALRYFLHGAEPYNALAVFGFIMLIAPFLPCFKDRRKAIIICFAIAHIGLVSVFPLESLCSWKLRKFDPQKWDEVHYIRNEMVEDIRNSGILENKSADEIEKILGEPDNITDFEDENQTVRFTYYSGNGSYILIDTENDKYRGIFYVPSTGIGQH